MDLPNRKQRRAWAREMGLLKEKNGMTFQKRLELSRRAQEAGKQIHLRNVEKNLEREEREKEEKETKKQQLELEKLLESGISLEEATRIVSSKKDKNDGALDS